MFLVVHPKTAMHDAFFYFNFINRKIAICNFFINRRGRHTYKNNYIGRVTSFLVFLSHLTCLSLKQTQKIDLTNEHD